MTPTPEVRSMEPPYENFGIGSIALYERLRAMRVKENEASYAVFFEGGKFRALMDCYNKFPSSSLPNHYEGDSKPIKNYPKEFPDKPGHLRRIVATFLFEVVEYFGEEQEIAVVAMNYLDRFLVERFCQDDEHIMISPDLLRDEMANDVIPLKFEKILDVYALACLGIAIKLFSPTSGCLVRGKRFKIKEVTSESKPGHVAAKSTNTSARRAIFDGHRNNSLVEIGCGNISAIDIANVERVILTGLSYRLVPPTSFAFIDNALQLVSFEDVKFVSDSLKRSSKLQLQLGSLDMELLQYPPSIVAAAALSNAVHNHLTTLLPNRSQPQTQSFPIYQKCVSKMRDIIFRMEKALQISIESDQRLVSLRSRLNSLTFGEVSETDSTIFQYSRDTSIEDLTTEITEVSKIEPQPIIRNQIRHVKETPPKTKRQSDADDNKSIWDASDCFVSLAFESLLPDSTKVERTPCTKENIPREATHSINAALVDHYNKYIKPQIYRQDGTSESQSDLKGHVVHTVPIQALNSYRPDNGRCSF